MIKRLLILVVFGFLFTIFATSVSAQTTTIEVSGNGDNSQNSVDVAVTQQTTVQSTNEAQLNNNVNSQANSGENTTNSNVADATITTGDISQNVAVENDVNTNVISVNGCGGCNTNLEIKNSGNGANSQNTISTNVSSKTNITATNIANVTNRAQGAAVTGKNSANNNLGNVSIDTGNVSVKINGGIVNKINKTLIRVDPASTQNIKIFNVANGANSINSIKVAISNILNIEKIDIWQLENNVFWDIITGENTCNGNLGSCTIRTGDINLSFEIINSGNFDFVFVGAPQIPPIGPPAPEVPVQPGVQPPAAAQPGPAPVGPPGPAAPGEVLAALAQLPVTGPGSLVFLLLLWISLLMTGVVLRILGNRSPPVLLRLV